MSLIDDLRAAADKLPPSHVPVSNEVLGLLGAWIAYAEKGAAFIEAAGKGAEEVAKLWAPAEPAPAPAEPAAVDPPVETPPPGPPAGAAQDSTDPVARLQGEIAQLQAQLAAAEGANEHPTVTAEPGAAA